jgi:ABC-2 type transport system permease protein
MTLVLIRKLLRDIRVPLLVVLLLLAAFQCLWAKITQRIVGEIAPFFNAMAAARDLSQTDVESVLFKGPGKIIRTLMGGESITFDRAMDMMSIGYVHPMMQTIFCIWAIGRAAGAIAGEIDRGTMELLLAQPLARFRLVLAHFCVDLICIPLLCLSLWAGNWLGVWLVGPIEVHLPPSSKLPLIMQRPVDPELLKVDPAAFGPALLVVGSLIFAVSGYTLWLSALGRFRSRVLGIAVLVTLLQFLVNLIGQMWEDVCGWMRPFTVFYYYQPQQVILGRGWAVDFSVWNHGAPLVHVPGVVVLLAVGLIGYALALWTFSRRDIPAPL